MTDSNFSASPTPPKQTFKVVPPTLGKTVPPSPPQPQESPSPETVNPAKPFQKLTVLGLILASFGYVSFVPEFPHSVKGDADIASTYNARQDVTLKVNGIVKEIAVKPNEQVKVGQKLVVLESEEIESAIAKAKTELGQAQSSLQDTLRATEELQAKLQEAIVTEQNTRTESAQLLQEITNLSRGNPLPQIQELESEISGLKAKKIQQQSNLNILTQQIERINAVTQEAGDLVIPKMRLEDMQREHHTRLGELKELDSQVARKKAQIDSLKKDLQDRKRRTEAQVNAASAAVMSVKESLKATQVVVADRRRQVAELEAEVKRQESKRQQLVLIASTTGTVITEDLDRLQNRWRPAGEKILEIVDLSELTVIAKIRQEDEKFIQQGSTVRFYKQGEIQPYITSVQSIASAPLIQENSIKPVWAVRLSIKNNEVNQMKPGMTGHVSIETEPMTLFEKLKHEVLTVVRPIFI